MFSLMFYFIILFIYLFILFLFFFCRTNAGAGQNFRSNSENFAPIANFHPLQLFGYQGDLSAAQVHH